MKVKNSKFEFPPEVPLDARPIISGLLSSEPTHRITLTQILNSQFFERVPKEENINTGLNTNNIFMDKDN